MNHNFYCAIDLGTTNTAIAYGTFNHKSKRFEAHIMRLKVPQSNGEFIEQEVVPSCVYMDQKANPIVGSYAKEMAAKVPRQVVTSVKSSMGTGREYYILDKKYTAPQISSYIIRFALANAKTFFRQFPDDVIITVPASFDSEMRRDTLKAAELAGIKVKNEDGSMRNILLDEPRAALYNFIDGLDRDLFPEAVLALEKPKNILVYDLGGGTLDVSLHKVWRDENEEVKFEDYAISRHTLVGGDNFDILFSRYLYNKIAHKVKGINHQEKEVGLQKLKKLAEKAKKDIVACYQQYKLIYEQQAIEEPIEEVVIEISHPAIMGGVPIDEKITEKEYEEVVAELLAKDYTLQDVARVEAGEILDVNNIIYPILDVLSKAYQKEGKCVKVDAVLLNGGMTKLPLIQRRLKEFFGIEPLEVQNPDLSVALGAVYYHHALHNGLQISNILNDGIGIETIGGYVRHLAKPGVILPFTSPVYDEFAVRDGTTSIEIPFYRGSREDTHLPNKQIAMREITFDRPLHKRDKISIQLEIDEAGIATTKAWINEDVAHKYTMEIRYLMEEEREAAEVEDARLKNIGRKNLKEAYEDTTEYVVGEGIIEQLMKQCKRYSREKYVQDKSNCMLKIKAAEKMIVSGSNKNELMGWLMQRMNKESDIFTLSRLALTAGNLMKVTGLNQQFLTYVSKEITDLKQSFFIETRKIQYYRYLIEAIGKTGDNQIEEILRELLNIKRPNMRGLVDAVIISLGKVATTRESMDVLIRYLTISQEKTNISTLWAIGKIGSRENTHPIDISQVEYSIPVIIDIINKEQRQDVTYITYNGMYALIEIGDRRRRRDCISEESAKKILAVIKDLRRRQVKCAGANIMSLLEVGEILVNGDTLSKDQERNLLHIRSMLEPRDDK
nr:Hsp70 family protein [uncultured Cellulosilyticum sp.]